ncbi:MAG TPA: GTP-binding protein [Acidimicrobiales bacterium]|nr:GTP-binding protein [Acidimicrobiales bacterium]
MDLLRFAIVGSVDDGKSTLIGRLLHDTRQLFEDQVEALHTASRRRGLTEVELAFVTDGLRAEREQGITIDVAYRYAATPNRKLVIADCPGHVQYTRNMATGASTAELAVVVVDAKSGLKEQTRRHLCIAALLGVGQAVVCVNKMDLVDWRQDAFEAAAAEVTGLAERLGMRRVEAVPISALHGDNVVDRSSGARWYDGPTVLEAIESVPVAGLGTQAGGARLPVQWVSRLPGGGRAYSGMLAGGPLRPGDEVVVLPSGIRSRVTSVDTFDGPVDEAVGGLSVTVHLAGDVDVARGDMLASAEDRPEVCTEVEATVCWFADRPLQAGWRGRLKHTTRLTPAMASDVTGRLDVNTLELAGARSLELNDIGVVRLTVATPLAVDSYRHNRTTGSFILIDDVTNATVAAGMVGAPALRPLGV